MLAFSLSTGKEKRYSTRWLVVRKKMKYGTSPATLLSTLTRNRRKYSLRFTIFKSLLVTSHKSLKWSEVLLGNFWFITTLFFTIHSFSLVSFFYNSFHHKIFHINLSESESFAFSQCMLYVHIFIVHGQNKIPYLFTVFVSFANKLDSYFFYSFGSRSRFLSPFGR